jgi:hypothetical protein
MAALDFPGAPALGQEYTANGVLFTWNGEAWVFNKFVGPPVPAPKVQIKRTDINNHAPAALDPGELAVEMGTPTRLWVGVPDSIDVTKKKLLVDQSSIFVEAPTDHKTYGRKDGAWNEVLPITGGVLTGSLELASVPTAAPQAANKGYVDSTIASAIAPLAPLASPNFSGNPQAPTPATSDNDTSIATTAFVQAAVAAAIAALPGAVPATYGQCRLIKSGANIVLTPINGNKLTINGVACTIPAAGVSLAPTGLTALTRYNIYAVATAGVVTSLEASVTAHAMDVATANNIGVEIKTGDPTRTMVGQVRPIAGPAFADSATQRLVRSWFNRRNLGLQSAVVNPGVTATVVTDIGVFLEFLAWQDESVMINLAGSNLNGTDTSYTSYIMPFFDGASALSGQLGAGRTVANNYIPVGGGCVVSGMTEGYHFTGAGAYNNVASKTTNYTVSISSLVGI